MYAGVSSRILAIYKTIYLMEIKSWSQLDPVASPKGHSCEGWYAFETPEKSPCDRQIQITVGASSIDPEPIAPIESAQAGYRGIWRRLRRSVPAIRNQIPRPILAES